MVSQSLRHGTNCKVSVKKAIGVCSKREAFSLAVTVPGYQQLGDRARRGVCSHVLLGASSVTT